MTDTSTRRSFLAAVPAALAVGAFPTIAVAMPQQHPDAELILMVERLRGGLAESHRLSELEEPEYCSDAYFDQYTANDRLMREIAVYPAATLDGLKAKANAGRIVFGFDPSKPVQFGSLGGGIPEGIVRDLLRLAGAATQGGVA